MAKRLTDKEKKGIIAYYTECQNYRKTARKFGRNDKTIKNIIEGDKDFLQKSAHKKEENTQSVLDKFESLAKVKNNILNNSLMTIANKIQNGEVSTGDLIRIYGVLLDKEFAYKELKQKEKESQREEKIQRIQIINDLPKGEKNENN